MDRKNLLAMLHLGANRLGMDDPTYRAWLDKHTGKQSAALCSLKELSALVDLLREAGSLSDPAPPPRVAAGKGDDRPTERQWQAARTYAKKIGLEGDLDGAQFAAFVKRIAKIDSPRFLTRAKMQSVLIGLEKWADDRTRRNASATTNHNGRAE